MQTSERYPTCTLFPPYPISRSKSSPIYLAFGKWTQDLHQCGLSPIKTARFSAIPPMNAPNKLWIPALEKVGPHPLLPAVPLRRDPSRKSYDAPLSCHRHKRVRRRVLFNAHAPGVCPPLLGLRGVGRQGAPESV